VLPAPTNDHANSPDAQPPTTSQTSVNSGVSKRVVSNGEQVVLDSDSDDSLVDLDFGIVGSSFKTVAPVTRSKRTTQHDEDGLRKPEKKVKTKKNQLDHVVEQAQRTRELERIINERKADLENDVGEASNTHFVFDEDALGQAVQDDDDPDKAHRLFLAMQRTNASRVENVFHFFGDTSECATQPKFPIHCLPEHRWTTSFRGL
jgi:hypothetical protein